MSHPNTTTTHTSKWNNKALFDAVKNDDLAFFKKWVENPDNPIDGVITRLWGYPYSGYLMAHVAIASHAEQITQYIIKEMKQRGIDINRRVWGDWTLLHLARFFGNKNIINFLEDMGAKYIYTAFDDTPSRAIRYGKSIWAGNKTTDN